jgi:hypothetical protein
MGLYGELMYPIERAWKEQGGIRAKSKVPCSFGGGRRNQLLMLVGLVVSS